MGPGVVMYAAVEERRNGEGLRWRTPARLYLSVSAFFECGRPVSLMHTRYDN